MSRPDRFPDPHPVPRQRIVLLTALDRRLNKAPVDSILAIRGINPTLPYQEAEQPDGSMLYTQDIPEDAA